MAKKSGLSDWLRIRSEDLQGQLDSVVAWPVRALRQGHYTTVLARAQDMRDQVTQTRKDQTVEKRDQSRFKAVEAYCLSDPGKSGWSQTSRTPSAQEQQALDVLKQPTFAKSIALRQGKKIKFDELKKLVGAGKEATSRTSLEKTAAAFLKRIEEDKSFTVTASTSSTSTLTDDVQNALCAYAVLKAQDPSVLNPSVINAADLAAAYSTSTSTSDSFDSTNLPEAVETHLKTLTEAHELIELSAKYKGEPMAEAMTFAPDLTRAMAEHAQKDASIATHQCYVKMCRTLQRMRLTGEDMKADKGYKAIKKKMTASCKSTDIKAEFKHKLQSKLVRQWDRIPHDNVDQGVASQLSKYLSKDDTPSGKKNLADFNRRGNKKVGRHKWTRKLKHLNTDVKRQLRPALQALKQGFTALQVTAAAMQADGGKGQSWTDKMILWCTPAQKKEANRDHKNQAAATYKAEKLEGVFDSTVESDASSGTVQTGPF